MKNIKEIAIISLIIIVLMILVMPVVSLTKWQVKRDMCLSNMKKIGEAFSLYAQDNNNMVPRYPTWTNEKGELGLDPTYIHSYAEYAETSPAHKFCVNTNLFDGLVNVNHFITWADLVYPYVKDINVFICPMGEASGLGYAINSNLYGNKDKSGGEIINKERNLKNLPTYKYSDFKNTKETVLLADSPQNEHPYVKDKYASYVSISYYTMKVYDYKVNATRHEGGVNLLMCDGHVENVRNHKGALENNDYYERIYNDKGLKYWDPFL